MTGPAANGGPDGRLLTLNGQQLLLRCPAVVELLGDLSTDQDQNSEPEPPEPDTPRPEPDTPRPEPDTPGPEPNTSKLRTRHTKTCGNTQQNKGRDLWLPELLDPRADLLLDGAVGLFDGLDLRRTDRRVVRGETAEGETAEAETAEG